MSLSSITNNISQAACLLNENENGQAVKLLADTVKSPLAGFVDGTTIAFETHLEYEQRLFENACQVYCIDTPFINSEDNVSPDNVFRFYRKAFALKPLTEGADPKSISNQLIGITMYNLGLGYHRQGMQTGNSRLLRKALNMYSVALAAMRHYSTGGIERFIAIAITNNIGHLHALDFETDRAETVLVFYQSSLRAVGCGMVCWLRKNFSHSPVDAFSLLLRSQLVRAAHSYIRLEQITFHCQRLSPCRLLRSANIVH